MVWHPVVYVNFLLQAISVRRVAWQTWKLNKKLTWVFLISTGTTISVLQVNKDGALEGVLLQPFLVTLLAVNVQRGKKLGLENLIRLKEGVLRIEKVTSPWESWRKVEKILTAASNFYFRNQILFLCWE